MHLLLSVTMVAAALAGLVTTAAARRPDAVSIAQAGAAAAAMLLHALGLLGPGSPFGSTGLFVTAIVLALLSVAGVASDRRSGPAVTRAVTGVGMSFLLIVTTSFGDGQHTPSAHHALATAPAASAAVLGVVALGGAGFAGIRMLRARRYGSGIECLSMGMCLVGMSAMAVV